MLKLTNKDWQIVDNCFKDYGPLDKDFMKKLHVFVNARGYLECNGPVDLKIVTEKSNQSLPLVSEIRNNLLRGAGSIVPPSETAQKSDSEFTESLLLFTTQPPPSPKQSPSKSFSPPVQSPSKILFSPTHSISYGSDEPMKDNETENGYLERSSPPKNPGFTWDTKSQKLVPPAILTSDDEIEADFNLTGDMLIKKFLGKCDGMIQHTCSKNVNQAWVNDMLMEHFF